MGKFVAILATSIGLAAAVAVAWAGGQKPRPPDWVKVTDRAGWTPRDSQGEVVFNDRLWILGGWFDSFSTPPRDVWNSPDGRVWDKVTDAAPWRHSDLPMTLSFDGRIWLMGGWYKGRLPGHSAGNEVWSFDRRKGLGARHEGCRLVPEACCRGGCIQGSDVGPWRH